MAGDVVFETPILKKAKGTKKEICKNAIQKTRNENKKTKSSFQDKKRERERESDHYKDTNKNKKKWKTEGRRRFQVEKKIQKKQEKKYFNFLMVETFKKKREKDSIVCVPFFSKTKESNKKNTDQ